MGLLAKPIPFGDYFLVEKVNTGGMAEVFKAKTFGVEGFERIVAVKKILPSIAEDKEFISMFIDEAKIAGQLTHANIAQIFDLGNINDEYYIALEYVSGHDLRVIYDRCVRTNTKLSIGCVCFIVSKICEGLDYAHNKKDANGEPMNIIHRDISPQNILIGYEGECKLIDFGIAKATNKSSATQVGILKGKFSYMSPEQVSGKTNIDRRSDIFALGIVLFELLTLKRLFLGSSDFETLEKIRKVEVSPPTLYNSDIPEELEDIVLKALEKDVNQRYQTANELQEAIQRFMFKQNIYYTAKDLSEFMHTTFAQEIALEQKKKEFIRGLTRSVLDASKKAESPEDETNFYDRQHVGRMSGVQYEAITSNQPAPKQAIYAELDDFQPPTESIVYSQKNKVEKKDPPLKGNLKLTEDVISSMTAPAPGEVKPRAIARKSTASLPPVVVNKGHETLVLEPVKKKNDSRGLLIAIVGILVILFIFLIVFVIFRIQKDANTHDGQLTFNVLPADAVVTLEINDDPPQTNLTSPIFAKNLATSTNTRYRITAAGFEPIEGTIRADNDGETVDVKLQPAQGMLIRVYVDTELATVTINGKKVEGERNFEIKPDYPGEQIIRVSKEGYKTEERKLSIENAQQQSLTFELKPAVATLVLKTDPYEATFKLTNQRTGESTTGKATPSGFRIPDLPVDDQYSIVIYDGNTTTETIWQPKILSLPNEEQTRVFTTHAPGSVAVIPEQATPEPAKVTSKSGSDKSSSKSNTSRNQTKKPNDTKQDTAKKTETPAPEQKKVEPAAPAESKTPGMLQIASKPPAHVFINGKDRGSTPLKLELPAGTYTLKFVNEEQGINSSQTVTVKGGETQKVMRK